MIKQLITLALSLLLCGTALAARTPDQQATIGTLRRVDKNGYLFEIQYKADYRLDQVIADQPLDPAALLSAIHKQLLSDSSFSYTPLPSSFQCTALACTTPESAPLLAHNYDMTNDDRATVVVHTAPVGKYASVGLADMGWLGMTKDAFLSSMTGQEALLYAPYLVMDGVNEKGFAIATLSIPALNPNQEDNGFPKIFSGLIPRYMLDNARSVQDALTKFQELDVKMAFPKNHSFHWLLNDAYGDCAVVEFLNGHCSIQAKAFTAKHQTVANYWLSTDKKLPGENGFARVKLIEKNLKKNPLPTEQQTMDLLEATVLTKDPELKKSGLNMNLATNWSVVYNLEKLTAAICLRENFNQQLGFYIKQH